VEPTDLDEAGELALWDAVIIGDSGYTSADWDVFDVELEAWVTNGGGLVITGFGARTSVCAISPIIAGMLPVDCDDTAVPGASLTISDPTHPVSDEVGDFVITTSYLDTSPTLANNGQGLVEDGDGNWAAAVRDHGAGRVVYLAPAYMAANAYYPTYLRSGSPDWLLEEAVAWAAGCVDVDGDGQLDAGCGGDDCDDADADVYLGAPELCNGVDDDCDGTVPADEIDDDVDGATECEGDCDDADPALNTLDEDGDGFSTCDGDCDDLDASLNLADEDGDGHSTCDGDCDDLDATTHPDAVEVCGDGLDNDCSGLADDADEDLDGYIAADCGGDDCDDADAFLNPADFDNDGYSTCDGDCDDADALLTPEDLDGDGVAGCDGDCDDDDASLNLADVDGDGFTTCDDDCDDDEATRYPGATELCNAIDDDCDGEVPAFELDGDGDGLTGCDGDCLGDNPAVYPGADEVCGNGLDDDCDGMTDAADRLDCEEPPASATTSSPTGCSLSGANPSGRTLAVWLLLAAGLMRRRTT